MAENLLVDVTASKKDKYELLLPQISALIEGESNVVANIANVIAALKQSFNWLWVGVYFVEGETLVLGPFQGPIACTRISKGKGVCGSAWQNKQTVLVPDVDAFPGHIACSSLSKSEIVVPVFKGEEVAFIIDIDSEFLADFDQTDVYYVELIAGLLESSL